MTAPLPTRRHVLSDPRSMARGRVRPLRGFAAAAAFVGAMLAGVVDVSAQSNEAPGLEVGFGVGWLGGTSFGSSEAALRTRDGEDFLLFNTESRLGSAPVFEIRASYGLSRRYALEGRFALAHPEVRTSVTGDIEGAPDLELMEQTDQYTFDGALLVMFADAQSESLVPFVSLGAGYLRQLHEGQTLVENGVVFHAGGGLRQVFFTSQQGGVKSVGVRGDARLDVRSGGINLSDGPTTNLSFVAGVFVGF